MKQRHGKDLKVLETIFPPVLTKHDFVKRFAAGEFGNRGPMWNTWFDWLKETTECRNSILFHIRNRVAGAQTWYNVPKYKMADAWVEATSKFDPSQLYIAEMAPTDRTVIQGEVMQTERGLYFYYSTVKKPMREALAERPCEAIGLVASTMLRHYMDHMSWEWLNLLLRRYPEHVVELSVYGVNWGTIPNRNTVVWEVRRY